MSQLSDRLAHNVERAARACAAGDPRVTGVPVKTLMKGAMIDALAADASSVITPGLKKGTVVDTKAIAADLKKHYAATGTGHPAGGGDGITVHNDAGNYVAYHGGSGITSGEHLSERAARAELKDRMAAADKKEREYAKAERAGMRMPEAEANRRADAMLKAHSFLRDKMGLGGAKFDHAARYHAAVRDFYSGKGDRAQFDHLGRLANAAKSEAGLKESELTRIWNNAAGGRGLGS